MTPEIQQQIDEAIKYRDAQRAWEVLVAVSKDGTINLPRPDYLRLNYLRMNALDSDRVLALVKESVLEAYQIPEFDLDQRLADYFDLLDFTDVQIDFLYKLKAILADHQELLGNQKITVNGKQVSPTISNWIIDYESMINAESKDALGEMRYINTGANLKVLSVAQRKALQNILKMYDKISSLLDLYEEIPDNIPPEEFARFQEWATKKFEEINGPETAPLPPPQPAVQPVAQPIAQSKPVPPKPRPQFNAKSASSPAADLKTIPVVLDSTTPKPASSIPLQKDLDLSTAPKRGLIFDTPTNVNLDEEVDFRKNRDKQIQQAQKIQAKLEELKKRKKT